MIDHDNQQSNQELPSHVSSFVDTDDVTLELRTFYGDIPDEYFEVDDNLRTNSPDVLRRLKLQAAATKNALGDLPGAENG